MGYHQLTNAWLHIPRWTNVLQRLRISKDCHPHDGEGFSGEGLIWGFNKQTKWNRMGIYFRGSIYVTKKMIFWCFWKTEVILLPQHSSSLLSNRHDWFILWAYSLLRLSLIGFSFPWILFSFVSTLETKGKRRKAKETKGKPWKSSSPKPKEIKGYQRKNEII